MTGAAPSADLNYNGVGAADVTVLNTDDDPSGSRSRPPPVTTTEAGGTTAFAVVLDTRPAYDVVAFSSDASKARYCRSG